MLWCRKGSTTWQGGWLRGRAVEAGRCTLSGRRHGVGCREKASPLWALLFSRSLGTLAWTMKSGHKGKSPVRKHPPSSSGKEPISCPLFRAETPHQNPNKTPGNTERLEMKEDWEDVSPRSRERAQAASLGPTYPSNKDAHSTRSCHTEACNLPGSPSCLPPVRGARQEAAPARQRAEQQSCGESALERSTPAPEVFSGTFCPPIALVEGQGKGAWQRPKGKARPWPALPLPWSTGMRRGLLDALSRAHTGLGRRLLTGEPGSCLGAATSF